MSSVSGTSNYWKTPTSTATTSSTGTNDLTDFQSFLQLMATELQNQDPTNPVSNTEYVSQMAQMTSLQQLQSIGVDIAAQTGYSLIGKSVTYTTTDSSGASTSSTGTVSSVTVKDSTVYLTVGSDSVLLSAVTQVGSDSSSSS
ncbi:MAG: flagellar hook capping FlgD N-terminal domain-containing protein [Negativicutes bacterium]|nr:flagellar hook capping FlgD N-terminal domain-containing protein [Negativicutes bacterium]